MIKLRSLFLLMSLIACLRILYAQNTVGLLSIKGTQVSEGYNLIYPYSQSTVFLIDLCGEVVHRWIDFSGREPGCSVYLLPNGNLIRCSRDKDFSMDAFVAGGFGGYVDILSWENKMLYSYTLNDSLYRLHHDVAPMPNGHILMLAWEKITPLQAIAQGRDPNTLPNDALWPDKILEWDPQSDSIVWEWRAWDHLIQDRDSLLPNFGVIAKHPEHIDVNFSAAGGQPDWMHTNYIDYNPVLDQIMISVRNFNEIWIIDHSTSLEEAREDSGGRSGKGGGILYRWGNPSAYRRDDEQLHLLKAQHYAHWTKPDALPLEDQFGEVAIYNNLQEFNKSAAILIKVDFDTVNWNYPIEDSIFGPQVPERIILHPDDNNILAFSNTVSNVQKLANGNILIFAGRWGYAYEIDEMDEVVWEYRIPMRNGASVSQGSVLDLDDNLTFHMTRYDQDYAAFSNRRFSQGSYLELNPDEGFCTLQTSSVPQFSSESTLQIWPNPVSNFLHIIGEVPNNISCLILDLNSQVVKKLYTLDNSVDVTNLPNGLYLLKTSNGAMSRFVVLH
ncbi:MAG: aryl-sulfate sulfotransferase [Saprospiraceae bacterium]|nr:aryl-sulfate sulfotransferase [Saprospiraceae bacterium]